MFVNALQPVSLLTGSYWQAVAGRLIYPDGKGSEGQICVRVPACSTLSEPIAFVARKYGMDPMPHYAIFNGLLLVLLVLHTYWSWLILQVRPAWARTMHTTCSWGAACSAK